MPQKSEPRQTVRYSFWEQEEPGIRVPYHAVRHALGNSGPVRIRGLELTRAGDVVILRAVNVRDQLLRQFIELPLTSAVLRQVAAVLEEFAAQAEAETAALRQRLAQAEQRRVRPDPAQRTKRAIAVAQRGKGRHGRSESGSG